MHTHRIPNQHGLTLTESITALLVLAIGVLCIATVYLERTQAAPAVLMHSKASRLAAELEVQIRMRHSAQVHFENPVGVVCNPQLSNASPQRLATNDIACWQDKVAQTLPNGSGAIAYESENVSPAYLITVSWSSAGSGTASYLLRVEPPGLSTQAKATSPADATRAAN